MKKMLLYSRQRRPSRVGREDSHSSHGQWGSEFEHSLAGVESLPVDLDDDVVFGAEFDPRFVSVAATTATAVAGVSSSKQSIKDVGYRGYESIGQVSGADDGTFYRCD